MRLLAPSVAVGALGLAAVGLLAVGGTVHARNEERAIAQFEDLALRHAESAAAQLQSDLAAAARQLRVLASDPWCDAVRRPGCLPLRVPEPPRPFTSLAVWPQHAAPDGGTGGPAPVGAWSAELATAWAAARDVARPGRVRAELTASPRPSLVLLTPGPDTVAAAQVPIDTFLASYRTDPRPGGSGCETVILDVDDGTVVFDSAGSDARRPNAPLDRIAGMRRGVLEYAAGGADMLAAFAPIAFEDERWAVVVTVPRGRVVAPLAAELRALSAIGGLLVLLVVGGAAIVWRRAGRRIRAEAKADRDGRLEKSHAELTAVSAKLETAAQEWRAIADTIDAGLIVIGPGGAVQRMNKAAAATLPGSLFAWLGRPAAELAVHQPWQSALALVDRAGDFDAVATGRIADAASGRTWDLWCRRLQTAAQERGVLVLARDVTEVVELQESVRRSETMASLGSVVAGVAHEVRNPLFAISSLVDAWAVQPHRDPTPFVDALRTEVARLRTLMTDLLEYGKPAKITLQQQSIARIVDAAVQGCAHEAAARRVQVVVRHAVDAQVLADGRRLERVFVNVIQNALQHAPADSTVSVDTTAPATQPPRIEVAVRDRGPGIKSEDLPRIFTPFFSRRQGGFGLGLAISERIVTEHKGRMGAANDPGGGAVVTVSLPFIAMAPRDGVGPGETCAQEPAVDRGR